MGLENAEVGKITLSGDDRLDFLERQVASLTNRVWQLEEEVKRLKKEKS